MYLFSDGAVFDLSGPGMEPPWFQQCLSYVSETWRVYSGSENVSFEPTSWVDDVTWCSNYIKVLTGRHLESPILDFLVFPRRQSTTKIRDFKQRQREPQRERESRRENPNNQLRITGGKNSDVLWSVPTWVELVSRCAKTWVFFFAFSAVFTLNNLLVRFVKTFIAGIFH